MSKSLGKFLRKVDPIGSRAATAAGVDPIAAKEKKAKEAAAAAAAAAAAGAPSGAGIQRARALSERQGDIKSAAAAAGAVRSGNEADTLGKTVSRKKRSASAALLGE